MIKQDGVLLERQNNKDKNVIPCQATDGGMINLFKKIPNVEKRML